MQVHTLHPRGGLTFHWCAYSTAIATLVTCTIAGNAAVLVALGRARRAPAHYPLASLAAADLLVGLFVQPIAAVRELFVLQLHWIVCVCWKTLDVLCCTASILSLCALGWERWSGITAPLARARRARQARLYAGLVWPVSIAVALPTAFIYSPKHLAGDIDKACLDNANVSYVFLSSLVSFYLPASVMLTLYARILCALSVPPQIRAHRGGSPCPRLSPIGNPCATTTSCSTPLPVKNTQQLQKNAISMSPRSTNLNLPLNKQVHCVTPSRDKNGVDLNMPVCSIMNRQRRATRTIVRLMAMFLGCWTPFFVIMPLDSLCDCVPDSVWQCFTWLGYVNSALNPLVYAAASPSVRRALKGSQSSSARATDMQISPSKRA